MFNSLKYEVKDNICTITLNRPEVYNAFNNEMSFELQDALKQATRDSEVRVVVLTGEGKAFCSGQDLKDVQGEDKRSLSDSIYKRYNPIIRGIRNMPKPMVARVNGVAAGAGCSLALACDIIVASEAASFIEVFVNIGLVLDSGSSFFLPNLVGYNKAFELSTLGSKVTAQQAFELGIVNKLASPDDLDEAVAAYASRYAVAPTKAIGLMKKMLNKAYSADMEEMLQYEAYCQEIAGRSHDYKEGAMAFLEKRKPEFKGE
jgi:2-(1,2-epoxy-1,2-dihydrophenyl)acetyl-CoA isomerase